MILKFNKINQLKKLSQFNINQYASLVNPHWLSLHGSKGFNKLHSQNLQTQSIDEDAKLKYMDKLKERAQKEGFESVEALLEHHKKQQQAREQAKTKATITVTSQSPEKTADATKQVKSKDSDDDSLNSIMKLELLESLDKENISQIWHEYHQSKSYLSAVIPKETYKLQYERSAKYPRFVIPIPRGEGVEFFYVQSEFHKVYFTSLLEYKTHLSQATPHLVVTHYPELSGSKDIVLMRGELVTNEGSNQPKLKLDEAQLLSLIYQKFYVLGKEQKLELVKQFNETPQEFDYHELMNQVNQLD